MSKITLETKPKVEGSVLVRDYIPSVTIKQLTTAVAAAKLAYDRMDFQKERVVEIIKIGWVQRPQFPVLIIEFGIVIAYPFSDKEEVSVRIQPNGVIVRPGTSFGQSPINFDDADEVGQLLLNGIAIGVSSKAAEVKAKAASFDRGWQEFLPSQA
ncbi:MAG TPA: hypothetical protein VIH52_03475 [Candidatus Nanoarchaeia archaeon]|nr:hypothetical protein [uncultured archaeon]